MFTHRSMLLNETPKQEATESVSNLVAATPEMKTEEAATGKKKPADEDVEPMSDVSDSEDQASKPLPEPEKPAAEPSAAESESELELAVENNPKTSSRWSDMSTEEAKHYFDNLAKTLAPKLVPLETAMRGKDLCSTANATRITIQIHSLSGHVQTLNGSFERAVDILVFDDQAYALVPTGAATVFDGTPGSDSRFSAVWMPSTIVAFVWLATKVHDFMSLQDILSISVPAGFDFIEGKTLRAMLDKTSSTSLMDRSKSNKLAVQGVVVTVYQAFAYKTWSHVLAEGLAVTMEGDMGSQCVIRGIITGTITSTHHYAVVERVGFGCDPEFVCLRTDSGKLQPVLPLSMANASLIAQMRARPPARRSRRLSSAPPHST